MSHLWNNLLRCLLLPVILLLSASVVFSGSRQNRKVASLPFEIADNLIILQGKVNGSGPLSFILDTGASASVINESRVRELGLQSQGQVDATTQGGSTEASFIKGVSLNLSGIEFPEMTFAAIRLSGLEAGLGRSVDGILGYEIFNRFVVEIDYASKLVTFYEPQSYQYSGREKALTINIEDNTPFVRAGISLPGAPPVEGKFQIDTGATGALNVTSPFAARHNLLSANSGAIQITSGAILAGRSSGRIARVRNLRLGRFNVGRPITHFSQDTEGDDASADYAGLIGGEILRRFKIIVDYSRRRMMFEPNRQFSAPYEFDMSGMSLAAGGSDFKTIKVRALVPNSPATVAGLQVGDIITAIDNRPVTEMTLEQIRQMFRQNERRYLLNIRRNDSSMQLRLRTRRLI